MRPGRRLVVGEDEEGEAWWCVAVVDSIEDPHKSW